MSSKHDLKRPKNLMKNLEHDSDWDEFCAECKEQLMFTVECLKPYFSLAWKIAVFLGGWWAFSAIMDMFVK